MLMHLGFLLIALPSYVFTQKLAALKDKVGTLAWSAEGGPANIPFEAWQPNLDSTEWKMLGQNCQTNYNRVLDTPIRRYREEKSEQGKYLIKPEGFQFIWDDRGSTVWQDGSAWRVSCPVGSVALGDFFYPGNRISQPTSLLSTVACLKAELTEECKFGERIWLDKGTWSLYDVSVWRVVPKDDQIPYFYVNNNHDNPPGIKPRCLKKSVITDLFEFDVEN